MTELPAGWVETDLESTTSKIGSGATPKGGHEAYFEEGVPLIRSMNVHFDGVRLKGLVHLSEAQAKALANVEVQQGDVLLNITGASIGRVAVAPPELAGARVNQHVAIVRTLEGIEPQYMRAYLASPDIQALIGGENYGVTRPALTKGLIEKISLPLPPLAEQRRIVAKLDALTARTARARADIDRIPALAARYKQAVLAKAFCGELTAEWRKAAKDAKPWQEVSMGEIAAITSGFGFPKDRQGLSEGDYPFAKVSDISKAVMNDGGMLSKAANYVRKADLVPLRAKPVPAGSVVFAKIGEALRLNRRALAVTEVILDNNCMALAPDVSRVAPRFLYQFMKTVDLSPFAVATAVPSIRRGDVANLRMPLPAIAEQVEIDRRIEVAFSEIDRLTAEAASARRLLDRLVQAVLAKAFRGELVPQDPTDEPASVLLDRIKAERGAEDMKPKSRGGRKPIGPKEQAMNGKPLPPRERILKDSENWPALGLPFEAIATRNAMPHDQLRDALFELLSGPSAALQQRFDTDAERMVIQRVEA